MRYNPPLSTLMSTGSPMATAPILGLSHLTFIVRDVDRTARLFCEGLGLDYVSCSPYRVPIARLAAAQAVIGGVKSATT